MLSGDKGAIAPRRGERTGERTGVTGEAVIMDLSTFEPMLRSIRNGLRSLPLGRTWALILRCSEWPLPLSLPALSGCTVLLGRRRAFGATNTSALEGSPKYTWPQAWSLPGSRSAMAGL
jgi:hypothetical protein